jgi:hypothetical protein
MGYSGDLLVHPGIETAYKLPLKNGYKVKERDTWLRGRIVKTKSRMLYATGSATVQWHPRSHTQIINGYGLGYQRLKNTKRIWYADLQLGFTSFFTSNNYQVNDRLEVTSSGVEVDSYWMIQPGIGTAWPVNSSSNRRCQITIWGTSLRVPFSLNYNAIVLPQVLAGIFIEFDTHSKRP